MTSLFPAGSDVSASIYRCTNSGNELEVGSTKAFAALPELRKRTVRDGQKRR